MEGCLLQQLPQVHNKLKSKSGTAPSIHLHSRHSFSYAHIMKHLALCLTHSKHLVCVGHKVSFVSAHFAYLYRELIPASVFPWNLISGLILELLLSHFSAWISGML